MLLKYLSKFVMDILPSVVATIIGAYIVNHYINTKPAADAPVAAAVSTVDPRRPRPRRQRPTPRAPKRVPRRHPTLRPLRIRPQLRPGRARLTRRRSRNPKRNPSTSRPRPRACRRKRDGISRQSTTGRWPRACPGACGRRRERGRSRLRPVRPRKNGATPTTSPARPSNACATRARLRARRTLARVAIRPDRVPRCRRCHLPIMVSTPSGDGYNPNATASLRPPYAPARGRRSAAADAAGRHPGAPRGRSICMPRPRHRCPSDQTVAEDVLSGGADRYSTRCAAARAQRCSFKTYRSSVRPCRRRGRSRFWRPRPWGAG